MKCPKCNTMIYFTKQEHLKAIDDITGEDVKKMMFDKLKNMNAEAERNSKKAEYDKDIVKRKELEYLFAKIIFLEELIHEIDKKQKPFMYENEKEAV